MPAPFPDELLKLKQVANHFSVSTRTVRRWIDAGELVACRIGRTIRIRREDLERFIRQHRR